MPLYKKFGYISIAIAILALTVFYLFSGQIRMGFMKGIDFATTVKVQGKIDTSERLRLAALVGDVMEGATFFASPEFSVLAIGILTLASVYDWKRKKIAVLGFLIPLFFGLLIGGEIYGKNVVHHPAPPFFMIKNPTTIFPKYYINAQYSYPSGHAARAVFMSFAVLAVCMMHSNSFFKRKKLMVNILLGSMVYVLIVSVSRIYLGHHWLSDIVGGSLLGLGFGLLTLGLNSLIIDKQ